MKKTLKILLPLALSAAVLLGALTGCGHPASEQEALPSMESSAVEEQPAAEPEPEKAPEETEEAEEAAEETPEKEEPTAPEKAPAEESAKPAPPKETAKPAPKPAPAEPKGMTCTISISCTTILNNFDKLDGAKQGLVPRDGWILKPTEVSFEAGENVFQVLRRTCKQHKIHMEFEDTPGYGSAYIEGIGNLYEFDCGDLSGWEYRVNGWFPGYGASRYELKDGDRVEWLYTCDLGADIGAPPVE